MQLHSFDFKDVECVGQPYSIYNFENRPSNYPTNYERIRQMRREFQCGRNPIEMEQGCCTSFLNGSIGSTLYSVSDKFPASANQHTYCRLETGRFNQLYILDNGRCVEGYRCANQSLWMYGSLTCSGQPSYYKLDQNPVKSESLNASIYTVNQGTALVIWKAFLPLYVVIPDDSHLTYYIGLMFFVLAILSTLFILGFYALRFYQGGTMFMLAYMFSQFIWLNWIVLDFYWVYSIFIDQRTSWLIATITKWCFGIASLSSVAITTNILLIFMKLDSFKNQFMAMIILLVAHFSLAGSLYVGTYLPDPFFDQIWGNLIAIWIIIMYFFDLTPPLFVFLSILRDMPLTIANVVQLCIFDKYVIVFLTLQGLNGTWFLAMISVIRYTSWLADDRDYLAMNGPMAFSFILHSVISCVLNHHIRFMISLGGQLGTIHSIQTLKRRNISLILKRSLAKNKADTQGDINVFQSNDETLREESLAIETQDDILRQQRAINSSLFGLNSMEISSLLEDCEVHQDKRKANTLRAHNLWNIDTSKVIVTRPSSAITSTGPDYYIDGVYSSSEDIHLRGINSPFSADTTSFGSASSPTRFRFPSLTLNQSNRDVDLKLTNLETIPEHESFIISPSNMTPSEVGVLSKSGSSHVKTTYSSIFQATLAQQFENQII